MKLNKPYKITWYDAASSTPEWKDNSETVELWQVETVGFLKEYDKKKIVMVLNIGEDMISQMIAIPRKWIKKIKRLQ